MKQIIGILAYFTAASVIILDIFFEGVPWPVTAVAVMLLVLGALWAWSDPKDAQQPSPCDCPKCVPPKRATAEDVR